MKAIRASLLLQISHKKIKSLSSNLEKKIPFYSVVYLSIFSHIITNIYVHIFVCACLSVYRSTHAQIHAHLL